MKPSSFLARSRSEPISRCLGTMVAYGFPRDELDLDLYLAERMGATVLEVLPDWGALPNARELRDRVHDRGLAIHSAHGCWGSRTIRAKRVDLASVDGTEREASVDDLHHCLDWIIEAGGKVLVVHPGGLSDRDDFQPRRGALAESLATLAERVRGSGLRIGVENMPPGVHPGSRMDDIARLITELGRPELGLTLDTGHAHIASTPAIETLASHGWLVSTHVHDNDGRRDTHAPPGHGSLDWDGWVAALDTIEYRGPIMLECIRAIRQNPEYLDEAFLSHLDRLTHGGRSPQFG